MKKQVLVVSAILLLTVAACVTPPPPPVAEPLPPAPTPTAAIDIPPSEVAPPSEVEPPAGSGPAAIVDAAIRFVAGELAVEASNVQVISVDAVDWNNSCLGAAQPDEMCLEVITPGYRVLLDVDGKQVAVHTNQAGTYMRLANPTQNVPGIKPVSIPWDPPVIYATVVRQLYSVDHTFGQAPLFPVVYLLRQTDDSVGEPGAPSNSQTIFPGDQQRITRLLADLPARWVWVDSLSDVPLDSTGSVLDGGAMITLGNISQQPDGLLHVPASIYMGMLAAGGQTYVLQPVEGVWQITGVTGPVWIS